MAYCRKCGSIVNTDYTFCENCGCDKNVKTEWTHGWVMTLCDECRKKEIEEFNKQFKIQ